MHFELNEEDYQKVVYTVAQNQFLVQVLPYTQPGMNTVQTPKDHDTLQMEEWSVMQWQPSLPENRMSDSLYQHVLKNKIK